MRCPVRIIHPSQLPLFVLMVSFVAGPRLALSAIPDANDVFAAAQIECGLAVVVGDELDLAVQMAETKPVLVFVATSSTKAGPMRASVVSSGLHGRGNNRRADGRPFAAGGQPGGGLRRHGAVDHRE